MVKVDVVRSTRRPQAVRRPRDPGTSETSGRGEGFDRPGPTSVSVPSVGRRGPMDGTPIAEYPE